MIFVICVLLSFCAFAQVESVSVEKFEEVLNAMDKRQLIDTRSEIEFSKQRISGAININPRDPDLLQKVEHFDKDKPVLIYCLVAVRTKRVMGILKRAGFTMVYELDGGIDAWISEGKPIEK